ncbi:NAD(P)/FAD-dependent oxidoreductase [Hydrogenophaga sp.]|uniref:NAD(P)/FAD-dependent oxidoreductase n=1 Tax=Hydrogenophaga sp. TaxID=1904254 RepID=UPI002FCA2CD3
MNHDKPGSERHECDVLVIGGGPAGSTISPMLAEKGHRVVLLEKAHHPRFHIGESLLPANLPLLERLGVADAVRAIGQYKPGAEFVSPHHEHTQTFEFADAWDKSMPYAYQVKRAEFDEILIRNAERKGVEVFEGCTARSVEFLPDNTVRVHAQHDDGRTTEWNAKFLVDASGRDTFLASRFKIKERNPRHNSAAVYGHFANARRNEGEAEGNITIFWFDHGWFWFIPLHDGATSVGMVTWPYNMKTRNGRSVEQFLMDNIATCKGLTERLEKAHLVAPVEATGNFSYAARRNHGNNYLMLGDAFTFIDPVFSSGVWLAMSGGELGAQTIDTCLREPARAAAALKRFDRHMRDGPKAFSWFIYRVTNPIMRDFFMGPRNIFRVKEALLSTLAGDVYGGAPIARSLLAFKALYFAANIMQPRRAFAAWRNRRANIRPVDDAALARSP